VLWSDDTSRGAIARTIQVFKIKRVPASGACSHILVRSS